MKYYLLLFCSLVVIACTPSSSKPSNSFDRTVAQKLDITLNMTQPRFSLGTPITLRFVLKNNENDSLRFCYLNSPVHKMVWSNYFSIVDMEGKQVPYIGKHKLHQGSILSEHYMTLAPKELKIYMVDLAAMYQINKRGRYSIRFVGDSINFMPNSTPVRFILE